MPNNHSDMNQSPPSLREAFAQPAALTMFFFGFTSGLPFLLVGGTLSAWLKDSGVSLEDIGLMSLAGLAYSVKFLWSPAVDRIRLPFLGKLLGQRRSWLLLAQIVLAFSLLLMSMIAPQGPALFFVGIIVIAALAGGQHNTCRRGNQHEGRRATNAGTCCSFHCDLLLHS